MILFHKINIENHGGSKNCARRLGKALKYVFSLSVFLNPLDSKSINQRWQWMLFLHNVSRNIKRSGIIVFSLLHFFLFLCFIIFESMLDFKNVRMWVKKYVIVIYKQCPKWKIDIDKVWIFNLQMVLESGSHFTEET